MVPIVGFIDDLRRQRDEQILVLIPAIIPSRLCFGILHNQVDLVLSAASRMSLTDLGRPGG